MLVLPNESSADVVFNKACDFLNLPCVLWLVYLSATILMVSANINRSDIILWVLFLKPLLITCEEGTKSIRG